MKKPIQHQRLHHCQSPVILKQMIEGFPHWKPYSFNHSNMCGIDNLLASILFFSGAKSFEHSVSWICGKKSPEHLQIHEGSVIVKPYLVSPEPGTPLIWYLLRKAGIRTGGCAGTDPVSYVQAAVFEHDREKQLKHEEYLVNAVRFFNILKKEFPRLIK